jgi:hypothetical protein
MQLVKIPDTNLVRDTQSMALINTNEAERNDYLSKVQMMRVQKHEINTVKSEINSLKDDVSEIKKLLLQLMDKGSNG